MQIQITYDFLLLLAEVRGSAVIMLSVSDPDEAVWNQDL